MYLPQGQNMKSSQPDPSLNFFGHLVDFCAYIQDLILILKRTEETDFPDDSDDTEEGLTHYIFPDIMRLSFVVTLLITLEDQFRIFCTILRDANGHVLKWTDLKGSALDRFIAYCEKVCNMPEVTDPTKMRNIRCLTYVRNCIVHSNSCVRDFPNEKEIRRFSTSVQGLNVEEDYIILTHEGCINCADIVKGFMEDAYNTALKKYPR